MDPKTKADEWFQYAECDLKVAEKLLNEFNHITCFHCQQAAEKYIKGLLVLTQTEFRKSHDLDYLLGLFAKDIPDDVLMAAEYLTEYGVEVRYPGGSATITSSEATAAIAHAQIIKSYILELAKQLETP